MENTELVPCRVCGKLFKPCRTCVNNNFNYKRVACCYEHGQEYFKQVIESRSKKVSNISKKKVEKENNK